MSPDGPTAITVAVLLSALGLKGTDLAKAITVVIRERQDPQKRKVALNDLITLAVSGVLGYLVVELLLKRSAWGDEITIGKQTLAELGTFSTVVFGLVFTAIASTLYDFKKAIGGDASDDSPRFIA